MALVPGLFLRLRHVMPAPHGRFGLFLALDHGPPRLLLRLFHHRRRIRLANSDRFALQRADQGVIDRDAIGLRALRPPNSA